MQLSIRLEMTLLKKWLYGCGLGLVALSTACSYQATVTDKELVAGRTATAGSPVVHCSAENQVKFESVAWKTALPQSAENPNTDTEQLFSQLHWESISVGKLVYADSMDIRLDSANPPGKLLQVRYASPDGAEFLRVAVLRPVPSRNNMYCVADHDLSRDTEAGEQPCITEYTGPARIISLTQLVSTNLDAIEVYDNSGWCGTGTKRGDEITVEYWGAEHGSLVRYFKGVIFEAWFESPNPPARVVSGKVTWSEGWPKKLNYVQSVQCSSDTTDPSADCIPGKQTTIYYFLDGQYLVESSS